MSRIDEAGGVGGVVGGLRSSVYGLGTALCFSVSPIFLRYGLRDFPSPVIAVGIGMTSAFLLYLLVLALRGHLGLLRARVSRSVLVTQVLAGLFIATGTWLRYEAVDRAPVAVVATLGRINIPVVLLLSPLFFVAGKDRVTVRLWLGAGLIIGGAAVITFYG